MKSYYVSISALVLIMFSACKKDDVLNPLPTGTVEFLAHYEPGTDLVLGNEESIAKLTFNNGELSYSKFLDKAPESSLLQNCDINNGIMVLGLRQIGVEENGGYMNLNDAALSYLPLVEATGTDDWAYFQPTTGDVSDNGYIIYSSATNDLFYGDEYRPYLVRFNTANMEKDVAINPTDFVLAQPELGGDTEIGILSRSMFASPDGRYAYGSVDGLGTDGGAIHWDYSILYKYDFVNKTYTRLGDVNDNDVSVNGMTSDKRYIVYSNDGQTKVLDLVSNQITFSDINTVNVKKNAWGKNGPCVGSSAGNLWYKDFASNNEYIVCSASGSGWIYNTMFSEDESKIYFMIEGNESNYLCVTDGITAGSSFDTLSAIPFEMENIMLIK